MDINEVTRGNWALFIGACLMLLGAWLAIAGWGMVTAARARQAAVEAEAARWEVDPKTGVRAFRYLKPETTKPETVPFISSEEADEIRKRKAQGGGK